MNELGERETESYLEYSLSGGIISVSRARARARHFGGANEHDVVHGSAGCVPAISTAPSSGEIGRRATISEDVAPRNERTHRRKRQLSRSPARARSLAHSLLATDRRGWLEKGGWVLSVVSPERSGGSDVVRIWPAFTAPALFHPFDVAKWRRRVGGVSVRTVLDVEQSAYVRNNVPAD